MCDDATQSGKVDATNIKLMQNLLKLLAGGVKHLRVDVGL